MPDTRPDPFELIDTPFSEAPLERWRAEALAGGAMGALQNVYDIVRADSAAAAARADEAEARTALIQHLCEKVEEFERRFADHVARLAEAEDARRADEAEQQRLDEEPIEFPSEPDDPEELEDAHTAIGHTPGGDLHDLPPVDEPLEIEEDDQHEFPDPELS
jgi:hypothetical protein